jgi:hypothetical protein
VGGILKPKNTNEINVVDIDLVCAVNPIEGLFHFYLDLLWYCSCVLW